MKLTISRGTLGVLEGTLSLRNENGVWKADVMNTALMGINRYALAAAEGFCSSVRSQQYGALGSFLGTGTAVEMSATSFAQNLTLQDTFDGPVTDCSVTQIGAGNTDSTATMSLSITRTKAGTRTGHVTMSANNDAWTLSAADPALLGTDYRPLLVGDQFCTNLQHGQLSAAYQLFDASWQQQYSLSSFKSGFDESGWSYYCTDPDMSTFTSSGGTASYHLDIEATGRDYYHTSATLHTTLDFALDAGTWYLDGYEYHS